MVNTPQGRVTQYVWSNRNWTLTGSRKGRASSYGYDPRIYPACVSDLAIMADWDGSGTKSQNHEDGQNVLYADSSVRFRPINYCSADPIDNIFIEGGLGADGKTTCWNADTDAFMVNGSAVLTLSYGEYAGLQEQ